MIRLLSIAIIGLILGIAVWYWVHGATIPEALELAVRELFGL